MNRKTLKSVLKLVKPHSFFVALSALCAVFSVAAALLIPVFTGDAIDCMLGKGSVDFSGVLKKVITIAAVALAAALSQYFMSLCNNKITYFVCRDLRGKLGKKLHSLPISYIDSHSFGDLLSRMISDVDAFADGLLMGFTQLFTGVITIGAILVIMFVLNRRIALAVFVLTPLSVFVSKFIATRTHKYFTRQASVRGEQTALINELIEGQQVLKAFGAESRSLEDFDKINSELQDAALKATFFSSLTNPSTRLVNNIVYAIVTLLGAVLCIAGGGIITVGGLSVFLSYANQYAKPFNEISGVITEFQNALTCAGRIEEVLEAENQPAEPENPLCPPVNGDVGFEAVSFRYVKERPLIENFDLDVESGQCVAIVGPTGCGKTTLINLLMRFYDVNSGAIKVDNADIRKMRRHDLRSRYGMVLQDTWLCHGTVKENIAYGKPDASDEEIIDAAKKAHAHSFIMRLKNGYDTEISGEGANLSAGQKQLLCIARAMLCRPPMLILDEATSSIDTRTELKIQAAFDEMMEGRTSFIVAHRLSTIKKADLILVMKDGKIIEKGNHSELLKKGGFYKALYESQFAKV